MYQSRHTKTVQQGFSMVELLVVIAIMGLLSSFIVASLTVARRKARDAVRVTEKNQIILALKMAYIDLGGWPVTGGGGFDWACLQPSGTCWGGWHPGLASLYTTLERYISPVPTPNASGSGNYATNAYLFQTKSAGGSPEAPHAGAYLIWMQEREIKQSQCTGLPRHYDAYWYCYEFLGP